MGCSHKEYEEFITKYGKILSINREILSQYELCRQVKKGVLFNINERSFVSYRQVIKIAVIIMGKILKFPCK